LVLGAVVAGTVVDFSNVEACRSLASGAPITLLRGRFSHPAQQEKELPVERTFTLTQLDAKIAEFRSRADALQHFRNEMAEMRPSAQSVFGVPCEPVPSLRSGTLQERVISTMKAGEIYTARMIAEALGADYRSVSTTLLRMEKRGRVKKAGRGKFRLLEMPQQEAGA
jgi:hypothetical protein